jgi:AraC-like DNA-binding protein
MILAPIHDRALRTIVRRAALPEEDVFHGAGDVREALQFGHPRILVCRWEDRFRIRVRFSLDQLSVPVLALAGPTIRGWRSAWEVDGLAVSQIDDAALRLRRLIREAGAEAEWVEAAYSDLSRTIERAIPEDFRGFSRRILESPVRYSTLGSLGDTFGLSAGALKARFRRRGLPSPYLYLSWLRLLAASRLLADPSKTILSASHGMGFASDGNFCRWVNSASGLTPTDLRGWKGRLVVILRLAEMFLSEEQLEVWDSFGGVFLQRVA